MSKRFNPAETLFAEHLKRQDFPTFDREVRFHPERDWRFDFANKELMLAIEIEGGIWTGGRHVRGQGYIEDMAKYNAAQMLGGTVLRFNSDQVLKGHTLEMVQAAIQARNQANH